MAYLYRCAAFKESYTKYNDKRTIDSILKKFINQKDLVQLRTLQKYFGNIFIYKKNTIRIVIQEYDKTGNGDKIYFLRHLLTQSDYDDRWQKIFPKINSGDWLKENPLNQDELNEAIADSTPKPAPPLQPPPHNMLSWLRDLKLNIRYNVYETEKWVSFSREENGEKDRMKQAQGSEYFKLIKHLAGIQKVDNVIIENIATSSKNRDIRLASCGDICIVYEATQDYLKDQENKPITALLLHGGGCKQTQDLAIKEKMADAINLNLLNDHGLTIESLARVAHKAYPLSDFTTLDEWVTIERNEEVINLALLEEQISLLKNIQLPRFINGQAGSGKSTMLFFLFAEICFQKIVDDKNFTGEIIFLTDNKELLKQAKDATGKLLKYNSQYASLQISDEMLRQINGWFSPFFDFLFNSLLDEEDKARFDSNKYLRFYDFKTAYEKSAIKGAFRKKYSAEICWYVITTFIKGYKYDKYLTPEDFKSIPKRDRNQIDEDTFQDIYTTVWLPFYKPKTEKEGYWDKLDLVRFILKNYIDVEKKYWVIFCDEAQDFTKIELQLLIQMSEFKNYDLSRIEQLPLLFAGDPFQTVNPVGFNLDRFKSLLHEEFMSELRFNCKEEQIIDDLRFNYRSVEEIVDLANLIQFIRFHFFDLKGIKQPQESKWGKSNQKPTKYTLNKDEIDKIAVKIKDRIILVPCEYGEENEFAENDSLLKMKNFGDVSNNEWVIKSSALSKGSEYSHVVLYKFGDYFADKFSSLRFSEIIEGNATLSENELFRISYFFNKLYVGITRSRRKLEIVDTERGMTLFWDVILNHRYVEKANHEEWSKINTVLLVSPANISDFDELTKEQILANADNDAKSGELFREPGKMESAAKLYRKGGNITKSNLCEAMALEFAQRYEEAGDRFKEIGEIDKAKHCYWTEGKWVKYLELIKKSSSNEEKANSLIANLVLFDAFDPVAFSESATDINQLLLTKNPVWKDDLMAKIEKVINVKNREWNTVALKAAASILKKLNFLSKESNSLLASLLFKAEDYRRACEVWSQIEHFNHRDYFKAKCELANGIDEKIFWLGKIEDKSSKDKILDLYATAKEQRLTLSDDARSTLRRILLERRMFTDYFLISKNETNWADLQKLVLENDLVFEDFLSQIREKASAGKQELAHVFNNELVKLLLARLQRESVFSSILSRNFSEQLSEYSIEAIAARIEQGLAVSGSPFKLSQHIIHGRTTAKLLEYIYDLLANDLLNESEFPVSVEDGQSFSPLANFSLSYLTFLNVHSSDYFKTAMVVNALKVLCKSFKGNSGYLESVRRIMVQVVSNEINKEAIRINTFIAWINVSYQHFSLYRSEFPAEKEFEDYINGIIKQNSLYSFDLRFLENINEVWLDKSDDSDLQSWKNKYLLKKGTARFTGAVLVKKEDETPGKSPAKAKEELDPFQLLLEKFEKGEISAEQIETLQTLLGKGKKKEKKSKK